MIWLYSFMGFGGKSICSYYSKLSQPAVVLFFMPVYSLLVAGVLHRKSLFLPNFFYFDARTFWSTFLRPKQCSGVPKLPNIRYEFNMTLRGSKQVLIVIVNPKKQGIVPVCLQSMPAPFEAKSTFSQLQSTTSVQPLLGNSVQTESADCHLVLLFQKLKTVTNLSLTRTASNYAYTTYVR